MKGAPVVHALVAALCLTSRGARAESPLARAVARLARERAGGATPASELLVGKLDKEGEAGRLSLSLPPSCFVAVVAGGAKLTALGLTVSAGGKEVARAEPKEARVALDFCSPAESGAAELAFTVVGRGGPDQFGLRVYRRARPGEVLRIRSPSGPGASVDDVLRDGTVDDVLRDGTTGTDLDTPVGGAAAAPAGKPSAYELADRQLDELAHKIAPGARRVGAPYRNLGRRRPDAEFVLPLASGGCYVVAAVSTGELRVDGMKLLPPGKGDTPVAQQSGGAPHTLAYCAAAEGGHRLRLVTRGEGYLAVGLYAK